MDQEWNVHIKDNCDVIVSLVRRSTSIITSAFVDQGSLAMNKDKEKKRKRLSNPEDEQNLGVLHANSGKLHRCSKYFDTCLSERWAGAEIIMSKTPVHLTLDVHTDVEYYKDCFSQMCSSKYKRIPNVNHCLKLLQVASQISYFDLVEDCVHYLTSVPWSHGDEKRIRQFATSVFYPSDCTADLSARLGLALTNMERHVLLLDITKHALCKCFDNAMTYDLYSWGSQGDYLELFSSGFRIVIDGTCQTLVENVLKHVTNCVKKIILEANEYLELHEGRGLYNLRWVVRLLLETRSAKGLVKYIVEESPLCEMLRKLSVSWQQDWVDIIHFVFAEVIEGRLLLKTSTRYLLLKEWTWILGVECNEVEELSKSQIQRTLCAFVKTFPYEMQKEIFSDWMGEDYRCHYPKCDDLSFLEIHTDWIASMQEKLISLEP